MVHAIAFLTVTNPESMAQYREKAGEALAKHGGAVVQVSRSPATLDGAPELPDVVALLSFPDAAAAHAWANDPELASIHDLRRGAGKSNIFVME